jgi:transposase InsO family protein
VICCTWTSSAIRGFAVPGHAVTGDQRTTAQNRLNPLGDDYFHAIIDDHSRLAYGELLTDEKSDTVTAFLERALSWFAGHGITCRRPMTDGAWSYTRNTSLRHLLTARQIRHIVTPPYTPRWNGKIERFHQTWNANRPKASATETAPLATEHCHTGSSTTTPAGPTAHSTTDHPPAALTTYPGRTA